MLTLTDKAQEKMRAALQTAPEHHEGIRIQVVGGGCSGFKYTIDFENQGIAGDEVIEMNGVKVFVDRGSSMYLDEVTVDWVESLTGSGFKFNNPNVKSTCGCGESFNV